MPDDPRDTPPFSVSGTPAPLVAAAALTGVEGLVAAMLGILEAFHTHAGAVVMGATTALFFTLYGVALVVCAYGLNRARPWSRGPVLLSQLIMLGMAWSFRGSPTTVFAGILVVVAVIVLAGLLHPASLAVLNRPDEHEA